MTPESEADLVVSLAARAAGAGHRTDPADRHRYTETVAGLAVGDATAWAVDAVAEQGGGSKDDEVADLLALASAWVERRPVRSMQMPSGLGRVAAPAGVVVAAPTATRSPADVLATVLACLSAGAAVVIVAHPSVVVSTTVLVAALAAIATAAGAPAGSVQCVGGAVGPLVTADVRVTTVLHGHPVGAVPVLIGPDADPVVVAGTVVNDGARHQGAGPFAPSVLIVARSIEAELCSALAPVAGTVLDGAAVAELRSTLSAGGDVGWGRSVTGMADLADGGGARLLVAPIPAMVPEDVLALPVAQPVVAMIGVSDAGAATRVLRAAVRVAGGPGPVCAVHGDAWGEPLSGAAVDAGFVRVVADGPTTPCDPLLAAASPPDSALRWAEIVGRATAPPARPSPAGPQPPYPYASNLRRS